MDDKNKEELSDGDFLTIVSSCFSDDFPSNNEVNYLINISPQQGADGEDKQPIGSILSLRS